MRSYYLPDDEVRCDICEEFVTVKDAHFQDGIYRCPTCLDKRRVGTRYDETIGSDLL